MVRYMKTPLLTVIVLAVFALHRSLSKPKWFVAGPKRGSNGNEGRVIQLGRMSF